MHNNYFFVRLIVWGPPEATIKSKKAFQQRSKQGTKSVLIIKLGGVSGHHRSFTHNMSSIKEMVSDLGDDDNDDTNSSESMQEVTTSSLTSLLEPSVLLHLLSFLTGNDALENWKANRRSCQLCPMNDERNPVISPELASIRGRFRLVCKDW